MSAFDGGWTPRCSVRFQPGVGVAIVGDGGVCLVLDDPRSDLVAHLRAALIDGDTSDSALESMVRAAGLDLPPFGLVTAEGHQVRVVVRGSVSASIRSSDGEVDVRGDRVQTWLEHVVDDVRSVRLAIGPTDVPTSDAPAFEVVVGVVPAETLDVVLVDRPELPLPPPMPEFPATPPPAGDHGATLITPFEQLDAGDAGGPMVPALSAAPIEPAASAPIAGSSEQVGTSGDYDHLFGATRFLTVEQAAVRADDAPVAGPPGTTPIVDAVRCPSGHLNPPQAGTCRVCAAVVLDRAPVGVERPVLGHLVFSDGREVSVGGPLLIGRSPTVEGVLTGEPPELVVVDSPMKEVSSTHLEVRPDGWQVIVVDLESTNGTVVTAPGAASRRLPPGEPQVIAPGTRVSLADEAQFTFRGPS